MNDSFIHAPDLPVTDAQANASAGTVTDADSKHVYRNYKARVFELLFSDPRPMPCSCTTASTAHPIPIPICWRSIPW